MSIQKYEKPIDSENGVVLYEQNKTFRDIADLMENEAFREFYDKYSDPMITWKSVSMFMYIYKELEKRVPTKLNKYEKINAIKELMDDKECRKTIIKEFLLL